jgi:dipeptidyl-peptidase-4
MLARVIDRVADFPAQLARTRRFTAGVPTDFAWSGDSAPVRYRRDRGLYEVAAGVERLLADRVDAFDGDALIRDGSLWTLGPGGPRPRTTPGPVTRVRSDPTGRRLAYAVAGALRLLEGEADRLLFPAGAVVDNPQIGYLVNDYVWAADGKRLLVSLVDDSDVPRRRPDGSVVEAGGGIPYAAPGEPNPRIALAVVGLDGQWVGMPVGEYLMRVGWDEHGPHAVVLTRDQRTLRLLAIDPATGASSVVHEQAGEPWVHVVPGLPARLADGTVVAHTDREDTRHLTVGGVPVTPGGLQVREVLSVGPGVLFTASVVPAETHLWSFRDGLRRVSDRPGAVRDGQFVHFDTPGRVTVVREGERPVAVPSGTGAGRLRAYRIGLKRASLILPPGHRAGVRLPVLLDPYGGPTRQRVTIVPDWRDLLSEWFAEHGFAVLVADGAGTPGGGPRDERRIHGDLHTEPLNDQIRSLYEAAALCPDLDLGRVGIRGWSFGGSLALAAVLRRPDVFHAAVAGAAVTDQRLFYADSRERYLGDPAVYPERYDAGDLASEAARLTRPLLLMHGLADTTVLPVHTTRMVAALRASDRPHEVHYLPGIGHSAIGSPATSEILTAQLTFLRHHLQP